MDSLTEKKIKKPIADLFAQHPFRDAIIVSAQVPSRERVLPGTSFKADFAFELSSGGWLFIEDDDAQRCLGNFVKYWFWMEQQKISVPASLVHVIGPGDPGQKLMLKFLQEKAHVTLPNFQSEVIFTESWDTEAWLEQMRVALRRLLNFA
jgi:hypothetical protein